MGTFAGVGSGLPLEELITSQLNVKRTQFEKQIVGRETLAKTTLSGVGQLKSALSTFVSSLEKMSKPSDFAGKMVTVKQNADDPLLSVEAKNTASAGSYDIKVTQMATGSRYTSKDGTFTSSKDVVATADGTLTFAVDGKSFDVELKAGDTLETLRSKLNEAGKEYGVSANLINENGKSRLIVDSAKTGAGNDLSITASTAELEKFQTTGPNAKMDVTLPAENALVNINGLDISHDSNKFENVVQDLTFTINRLSENDALGKPKATQMTVSNDTKKAKENIEAFVKSYNDLMGKMDDLSKRGTYVNGKKQDDGGLLPGDASIYAIRNMLFKTMGEGTGDNSSTLFNIGIKMDKDGRLSIDNTKLDNALKNEFDKVTDIFSGDNGLSTKLVPQLKEYTKSSGLLAKREEQLNTQVKGYTKERADFADEMEKYEKGLRAKYANLDVMIARMNSSSSALNSMLLSGI